MFLGMAGCRVKQPRYWSHNFDKNVKFIGGLVEGAKNERVKVGLYVYQPQSVASDN